MRRFRQFVMAALVASTVIVQSPPSMAETTRSAPFDSGYVCGNFGVPGTAYPIYQPGPYTPLCVSDPQYVVDYWLGTGINVGFTNPSATAARNGMLTVGGWDYFCGGCVNLPPHGYLAGIYEAGSTVSLPLPINTSKTVTASIDPTSIRMDEYERDLVLCLSYVESGSYTPLASDCFGKGQPLRDLSISFTTTKDGVSYGTYPGTIFVSLRTTNDFGAGAAIVKSVTVS